MYYIHHNGNIIEFLNYNEFIYRKKNWRNEVLKGDIPYNFYILQYKLGIKTVAWIDKNFFGL